MTKAVLAIAGLLCAVLPLRAGAQGKYPERAIRVVIPFAPGGIDLVHVPYKGGGQAVLETIAGQAPLVMTAISSATPYHQPVMLSSSLNVLFGPPGMPRVIVDPLQQTPMAVIRDAAFQKDLDSFGMDAAPDGTPEKAARLIKDEIAKWAPVVKATGMGPGGIAK